MQILDFAIPKDQQTVWDKHAPIVISDGDIHIYITDEIIDPANYNEVYHILNSTSARDRVYIHLNTPGGYLDTAYMLVNAIKECQSATTAVLTGTVASAGTIIALSCDFVVAKPHSAFMIHNYSSVHGGKGHEMKARQEFTDRTTEASFRSFYGGFLTPKEIREVIDGKDMWLTADEVNTRVESKLLGAATEVEASPSPSKKGRPRKVI